MAIPNAISRAESLLHLGPLLREETHNFAEDGYPNEACGLLLGRRIGGVTEVTWVTRARNLNEERSRDRYELDPSDFLRAERIAAERGIDVVGIWHSHPDHPPVLLNTNGFHHLSN